MGAAGDAGAEGAEGAVGAPVFSAGQSEARVVKQEGVGSYRDGREETQPAACRLSHGEAGVRHWNAALTVVLIRVGHQLLQRLLRGWWGRIT